MTCLRYLVISFDIPYRVLAMVHNTQNYWVFGLYLSSKILETRKHNVTVCSINFYFLFYPSSTHVPALSQFLLHIFLFSTAELAWSQVIK
jgi:hypothetical protein